MKTLHAYRHYMGVLFDRGERWKLVVAAVGGIVIALMDTASIVLVAPLTSAMSGSWDTGMAGRVADAVGITTQQGLVGLLLGLVVGGFILKDLFAIAYSWWSTSFTTSTRAAAQIAMSEYYMRLPYYHHAHLGLAVILRKSRTSVIQAYSAFANSVIGLFTQVFSVLVIALALIVVSPGIMVGLIVFLVSASVVFLRVVRPINARIGREQLDATQTEYNATFDAFGAIKETQLRNSYEFFLESIRVPAFSVARIARTSTFLNALPKQLMEILFMLGLAIVFSVSALLGGTADILSSIAVLVAAAFRVLPTVAGMIGSFTNIRQAEPGTREYVQSKLDSQRPGAVPQPVPHRGVVRLPMKAELRVRDLRFRYSESGPEILKGVDLTIPTGSTAAFVGSSGAGKSTLLDVIMGLQSPTSGVLLADGVDVSTNLPGWQRNIGVVPQEVFITDRTIAENVAFDQAKEDIDEKRVRKALRQADILAFVDEQPDGIWSSFGERGRRLSGGQRQRVGIARALYRDPQILILDEATSALDNETEARIAQTIAALHGEITVIIVAHRLSTVRDADMIAYLDEGQVEASGPFQELMERSPGFRHLAELGSLN